MARIVALDPVAAGGEDARSLDGEVARPQAPLAVDGIGLRRAGAEMQRQRRDQSDSDNRLSCADAWQALRLVFSRHIRGASAHRSIRLRQRHNCAHFGALLQG